MLKFESGRTHQIRVHLKGIGHPVVGDQVYSKGRDRRLWQKLGAERQMLHATNLKFKSAEGDIVEIRCDLPDDIMEIISKLKPLQV